ncbi:MAG: phosphorylase [Parvularculaceae bacterium]
MTRIVGIVCGLKSEAAAVRAALPPAVDARVAVSGANAARAESLARELAEAAGVAALLSVGVSGGLDPALAPGDLIVTGRVVRKGEAAPAGEEPLIYGADEIVASAGAKRDLRATTGAAAVDMESHGVARAAAVAALPFLAVRAIADPASDALPRAALGAVAPDGSTRVLATLAACARRPSDFPKLLALGRQSNAALARLRRDLGPIVHGFLRRLDL